MENVITKTTKILSIILVILILSSTALAQFQPPENLKISYLNKQGEWIDASEMGEQQNDGVTEAKFDIDYQEFTQTRISGEINQPSLLIIDNLHSEVIDGEFSNTYFWAVTSLEIKELPEKTLDVTTLPDSSLNLFAIGLKLGTCVTNNFVAELGTNNFFLDGGLGFGAGVKSGYSCL